MKLLLLSKYPYSNKKILITPKNSLLVTINQKIPSYDSNQDQKPSCSLENQKYNFGKYGFWKQSSNDKLWRGGEKQSFQCFIIFSLHGSFKAECYKDFKITKDWKLIIAKNFLQNRMQITLAFDLFKDDCFMSRNKHTFSKLCQIVRLTHHDPSSLVRNGNQQNDTKTQDIKILASC